MSYHRSHRLFFGGYWRDGNAVGQLFRINLYVIFCSDSLLPCPVPSSPLLLFFDPSYPIHPQPSTSCHPPPARFVPVTPGVLGNLYAAVDSDDVSNDDSNDLPATASNW